MPLASALPKSCTPKEHTCLGGGFHNAGIDYDLQGPCACPCCFGGDDVVNISKSCDVAAKTVGDSLEIHVITSFVSDFFSIQEL